jgi:hypothetical protein
MQQKIQTPRLGFFFCHFILHTKDLKGKVSKILTKQCTPKQFDQFGKQQAPTSLNYSLLLSQNSDQRSIIAKQKPKTARIKFDEVEKLSNISNGEKYASNLRVLALKSDQGRSQNRFSLIPIDHSCIMSSTDREKNSS